MRAGDLHRHAMANGRDTHCLGQRMLHPSDGVRLVVGQAARRTRLPRLVRIHLAHTVVSTLLILILDIASCRQEIQQSEDHGGLRSRELGDAAQTSHGELEPQPQRNTSNKPLVLFSVSDRKANSSDDKRDPDTNPGSGVRRL